MSNPPAAPEPPKQPPGYGASDPSKPSPDSPQVMASGSVPGEGGGPGGRPWRTTEKLAVVGVSSMSLVLVLVGVGLVAGGDAGVAVLYFLVVLPLLVYCVRTAIEARRRVQQGGPWAPTAACWHDAFASFTLAMLGAIGILMSAVLVLSVLLFIICMAKAR